jgi:divalent metal cation (Fe/Co/Zn/Cd) transporter
MAHSTHLHSGVRIEIVTVIWMTIEAVVSIGAGILASSALLTAFGIDSVIELMTGGVLLWRLQVEAQGSHRAHVVQAERRAHWIVAMALALLCLYVLATSIYGLIGYVVPESSFAGIGISLLAVLGMPFLAQEKKRVAKAINSKALAGDEACSIVCAYLAGTVLVGLLLNTLFQWWWAEHVAGLFFLYWLFGETKEAFEEIRKRGPRQGKATHQ